MTMLKKKAWDCLIGAIICSIITILGIPILVYLNTTGLFTRAGGIGGFIGGSIGGILGCLWAYRYSLKSWAKFDEREKTIVEKTRTISNYIFIFFLYFASFGLFNIAGPKFSVPAYVFPALFSAGAVLMFLTQSALIFIQIAKDKRNG
jgi:hypothetical protein